MKLIKRPLYIGKLLGFKDRELIKIVTGIRRCGKSTLFDLYIDELKKLGVKDNQIQLIKLEELENEGLLDYQTLYQHIMKRVVKGKNYIFLDEIQLVPNFQNAVRSLYEKRYLDLYLTGSNSKLQSGEWATSIAGRYVEIEMFPLSFAEFKSAYDPKDRFNLDKVYADYLDSSSFPYTLSFFDQNLRNFKPQINTYLEGIYNTIILKDVMENRNFPSSAKLKRVVKFIANCIGSEISIKKISDTITSDGLKILPTTIEDYLEALIDAYIIYKADRYDIKGKKLLKTLNKYYLVDLGLRRFLLGNKGTDQGHILENIVYLELLRRGYTVYIGKTRYNNKDLEIDFIAETPDGIEYYQVADTVQEPNTLQRELLPLKSINDNYPKFILTRDYGEIDHNGIKQINVLEWLLK